MISIKELEQARRGMGDPSDYSYDENDHRSFEVAGNDTSIWMDNSCDARGIVATVKAAPALIALAKAYLAVRNGAPSMEEMEALDLAAEEFTP